MFLPAPRAFTRPHNRPFAPAFLLGVSAPVSPRPRVRPKEMDVTDQELQKTEDLISRLEISVGQIFPRDGGNASLIATMIQSLNGLRSLLGLVRPH
jgi:hypothetical protein